MRLPHQKVHPLFLEYKRVAAIRPGIGNLLVRPIEPEKTRHGIEVRQSTDCNWQECEVLARGEMPEGADWPQGWIWKCEVGDHVLVNSNALAACAVDHGRDQLAIVNGEQVEAVLELREDEGVAPRLEPDAESLIILHEGEGSA